jgi:hypothetical protein
MANDKWRSDIESYHLIDMLHMMMIIAMSVLMVWHDSIDDVHLRLRYHYHDHHHDYDYDSCRAFSPRVHAYV